MSTIFLLMHDIWDFEDNLLNYDIIDVYSELGKAQNALALYLNDFEAELRLKDSTINQNNTFNRFSEPMENIIISASLHRGQCLHLGETKHLVSVRKFDIE